MTKSIRKLALRQETLRSLVDVRLREVHGGGTQDEAGGCPVDGKVVALAASAVVGVATCTAA